MYLHRKLCKYTSCMVLYCICRLPDEEAMTHTDPTWCRQEQPTPKTKMQTESHPALQLKYCSGESLSALLLGGEGEYRLHWCLGSLDLRALNSEDCLEDFQIIWDPRMEV